MLLAIDIGNTQTVIGVYDDEDLKHMWRLATSRTNTGDELYIKVRSLLATAGLEPSEIHGAILASVVPALIRSWTQMTQAMFGIELVLVNAQSVAPLVQCHHDALLQGTGADRLADLIAARNAYGDPVIVLDFGTATNMEVVDRDGFYCGGVIAPGLETSMNALSARASQLRDVPLEDPGTAIGANTQQAIQAGIVYGEVDRVDGLVRRIWAQLGYETPVVATGGLATSLAPLCSTVTATDTELTLRGLCEVYRATTK